MGKVLSTEKSIWNNLQKSVLQNYNFIKHIFLNPFTIFDVNSKGAACDNNPIVANVKTWNENGKWAGFSAIYIYPMYYDEK